MRAGAEQVVQLTTQLPSTLREVKDGLERRDGRKGKTEVVGIKTKGSEAKRRNAEK